MERARASRGDVQRLYAWCCAERDVLQARAEATQEGLMTLMTKEEQEVAP